MHPIFFSAWFPLSDGFQGGAPIPPIKTSKIGRYVDQLLETVISPPLPEGVRDRSIERLAEEVHASDCGVHRVVTFGGGTGLSTVLGGNSQFDDWPENPFVGLKQEFPCLDVVVCTTDDGGSTGLLLQDLPMIGIGDFRKLLLSLVLRENLQKAYDLDEPSTLRTLRVIHSVFNHRFPKGFNEFRYVKSPLLVVPENIRECCPKPLRDLLASLGEYICPGGAGPVILPGGHCLGNLLLTAAIFQAGGETALRPPGLPAISRGIEILSRAIGVTPGHLHPATPTPGQLVLRYSNGVAVRGQSKSAITRRLLPIDRVSLECCEIPRVSDLVCDAVREAELILFAPGSLYTSIMPILQIPAIVQAIRENRKALKILAANFWMQEGETDISRRNRYHGFHVSDLVEAYDHNVAGGSKGLFDVVLSANLEHIPGNVLRNYALEGKKPIFLDRDHVENLGVLPVEATIYSLERLTAAGVIHHDPQKFSLAVRTLLVAHRRLNLKHIQPPVRSLPVPTLDHYRSDGPLLCAYHRQTGSILAEKSFFPETLRNTMHEMIWDNRDIRIDHLNFFEGARIIPPAEWTRSKEWDNVLGYFDPEDGFLKIHEQIADTPERLRDNLLTALGESLLGRHLESRRWVTLEDERHWGAQRYEIRLRPETDRNCFLDDTALRTYLKLARMVESPRDRDTFGITLNAREGFLPPGLLFGLLYAWYLNNAYGEIMEYEMSLLRWSPKKLIPYQMEERNRKQALVGFFRHVVFRHEA